MQKTTSQELNFVAYEADAGKRLDRFLAERLKDKISRTKIQSLIKEKDVLLNDKFVKPHVSLKVNDTVCIKTETLTGHTLQAQHIPLEIVYEDESIIVINKPAGMVVHPSGNRQNDTLVNALLFHAKNLSTKAGSEKPGIVHRLDKDTSGLMVVAKNDYVHNELARQFKERSVWREYIAFARGIVNLDEGIIEAPIARSRLNRKKMCVNFSSTKEALTLYKVIERVGNITVLKLFPKTGRTHQIRVHLSHIGHPILGDVRYGGSKLIERQALHATTLGFIHPLSKKYTQFTSGLPKDLADFILELKGKKKL